MSLEEGPGEERIEWVQPPPGYCCPVCLGGQDERFGRLPVSSVLTCVHCYLDIHLAADRLEEPWLDVERQRQVEQATRGRILDDRIALVERVVRNLEARVHTPYSEEEAARVMDLMEWTRDRSDAHIANLPDRIQVSRYAVACLKARRDGLAPPPPLKAHLSVETSRVHRPESVPSASPVMRAAPEAVPVMSAAKAQPRTAGTAGLSAWEYRILAGDDRATLEAAANLLGGEGWELVNGSAGSPDSTLYLFLKRQRV